MDTKALLAAIDGEISRLQQVRQLLSNSSGSTVTKPQRRTMSEEARKRIAEAQRKRWAAAKTAKK
jgi:hypothetical protein